MTDYAWNAAATIIQSSFDGAGIEFVRQSNIPLHEAVRVAMEEIRIRFLADTIIEYDGGALRGAEIAAAYASPSYPHHRKLGRF
ncbi:MAG: hypothetical protein EPN45_09645 [Rhizobiaceae bacterium]|nr:MAG: hypothetical protein EPN45_09645 [Rhizobiaceae bacterium]